MIQFTPPGAGYRSSGERPAAAAPRLHQGPVPDRLRHRGHPRGAVGHDVEVSEAFHRRQRRVRWPGGRYLLDGAGSRTGIWTMAAPASSPRSVIRTATAGCSRGSRPPGSLPGRIDSATTNSGSSSEVASALRRAAGSPRAAREAHRGTVRGELARLVRRVHALVEQSGEELPAVKKFDDCDHAATCEVWSDRSPLRLIASILERELTPERVL